MFGNFLLSSVLGRKTQVYFEPHIACFVINSKPHFEITLDAAAQDDVETMAVGPPEVFFQLFARSMVRLGMVNVKTGGEGEIRRHCAVINSYWRLANFCSASVRSLVVAHGLSCLNVQLHFTILCIIFIYFLSLLRLF
jgi:hypothetical protein